MTVNRIGDRTSAAANSAAATKGKGGDVACARRARVRGRAEPISIASAACVISPPAHNNFPASWSSPILLERHRRLQFADRLRRNAADFCAAAWLHEMAIFDPPIHALGVKPAHG